MKAAAAGQPGQVLLVDFPEPAPGEKDFILEPTACGICATDVKLVTKGAKEIRFALGHELAGKIVHAPENPKWKVGQRVVVAPYLSCNQCFFCKHGQPTLCPHLYDVSILPGGLAERVLVPAELAQRGMFPIPQKLSDELASLAEPLGCAIKGVEDSSLQKGDSLLVIGDGPMGQLAAAAGRALGAKTVIVAGNLAHRLAVAKLHYADRVVDITCEDLAKAVADCTDRRGVDVVLATVSSGEALVSGIASVRSGGWVNAFAGVPEGTRIELDVRRLHYQQYHLTGSSGVAPEHMAKALDLLQSKEVDYSKIISERFSFTHTGEAVAYVENRVGLKAVVTFLE